MKSNYYLLVCAVFAILAANTMKAQDNKYTLSVWLNDESTYKFNVADIDSLTHDAAYFVASNGIAVNPVSLTLKTGTIGTLTATVSPNNATSQDYTWLSSDATVATVSATGTVTAIAPGTARIYAITRDGKFADICTVSVVSYYTETVNDVSFNMIAVAGGTFTMGGTTEQGSDAAADEFPTHSVTLSNYYIAEVMVTQDLWYAVTGKTPADVVEEYWTTAYGLGDRIPAYYVSYNDAKAFIAQLNNQTGKSYRLPTEAEWEYAARGGNQSQGYKYSGSNTVANVAWCSVGDIKHEVATKQPNELGIYDMSGNCMEFCSDFYGAYSSEPQTNPAGAISGTNVIVRSGGSNTEVIHSRVSRRGSIGQTLTRPHIGFRLACDNNE
jgi:formylglycine-generating enzyme required for sulfatase activity